MLPGPFRLEPKMGVGAYQTYSVHAPLSSHWRKATCEEFGCLAWKNGWITKAQTDEQADYIRRHSGRSYEVIGKNTFKFKPGQTCFGAADHRVRIEREAIYIARDGDFRGNPTGRRVVHERPELWVEDFAEHQERLKQLQERG